MLNLITPEDRIAEDVPCVPGDLFHMKDHVNISREGSSPLQVRKACRTRNVRGALICIGHK